MIGQWTGAFYMENLCADQQNLDQLV